MHPNVLEMSFDIALTKEDAPWLRPFIPNIDCGSRDSSSGNAAELLGHTYVSGLALIAIRPINDGDEVRECVCVFVWNVSKVNYNDLLCVCPETLQAMLCPGSSEHITLCTPSTFSCLSD